MTETLPVTCIRAGAPRAGSIGPVVDRVNTRVADLAGKLTCDGQVGELQVQSPVWEADYAESAEKAAV
jgi:long-subunit acyl-CoA synthetase (AMP-forming)